jgi:hypothetical protein
LSGVFICSYTVQFVLFVCTFALTALVYKQLTLPVIDGDMLPKLIVPFASPLWFAHVPAVPVYSVALVAEVRVGLLQLYVVVRVIEAAT